MSVEKEIKNYISSQPEPKASEMLKLHEMMLEIFPKEKLWFFDGKDSNNKTVSNPTIGYGSYQMKYAGGKTKESFPVGISGNTTGISVYIMGIKDKTWLPETFGKKLGKANVTGYCIKFKTVKDVDLDQLRSAVKLGLKQQG